MAEMGPMLPRRAFHCVLHRHRSPNRDGSDLAAGTVVDRHLGVRDPFVPSCLPPLLLVHSKQGGRAVWETGCGHKYQEHQERQNTKVSFEGTPQETFCSQQQVWHS